MQQPADVLIYGRRIKLEVVIPEQYVWEFMLEFGQKFPIKHVEGTKNIRPVDTYWDHFNGWGVTVTISASEEPEFYQFLRQFCAERSLTFREPEILPGPKAS